MMPKLGTERVSVQEPLLQYASEIGWEYIRPEDAERLRGGRTGLILKEFFTKQLLKLNIDFIDNLMIDELIKKIEKLPVSIEGNLQAWEYLKGLKTVYVPYEKRERNVKLIDENPKNNTYHVSDEFSFTNGKFTNRYDVVFFVNGIPLFFVEAKSVHKLEGMSEALEQVRRYHRETPEAMTVFQVYTLTHLIQFYYSATWNFSAKSIFNWKFEAGNREFEKLVKAFFDKKRVIQIVLDYILFTRKDDELQKVVLRPHQMRAIQKVVKRSGSRKKRGLIWHTQGSGKTYTMIVAAQKIIENPSFENPTVIMLVDRNELEAQLFGNLASVGFEHVHVAESKRHLKELLERDTRGLIVTMIHKFEGMPDKVNLRKTIFVLVDEAHRTTGGDLGNYLMGALPKATYIGFTGTPIDKTSHGKGTFVIFGKDDTPHGYLDKYGIAESIEDNTTVKLHYALASNELLPDKETLEKEFLDLKEAEGVSDIESLNKVLDKAVNLKNMLKSKDRIEKVTKYIAEHYTTTVEPLGYKAFIVAVDREACALYKEELDRHLPKEYSEVVYSPAQNDDPLLTKYYLSEEKEKMIRKAFIKPDQLPKILIVTEKLLTGFDAPILYCMYLDKPMRDHVLLQAIARVNRPYEDEQGIRKPCGFVLDFIGIFDKLEKALAFDSKDISEVVKDINILKERFKEMMGIAKKEYLSIIKGKQADKAVDSILNHFIDEEKRKEFYKFYDELSDMYEIISPDHFLRPYLDDYDTLSRMSRILKEAYEPSLLVNKELARKTSKLVQEHTKAGKIKAELEIYEINEETIKKLEQSDTSETEKIFNLLKSIEKEINDHVKDNPYLISIGERVEAISSSFKQRQKDTKETLESLKSIIEAINLAKEERIEKNMSADVFSVYWILKNEGIEQAEGIAREMETLLNEYPYWRESEEQERKVKEKLYKIIRVKTTETENFSSKPAMKTHVVRDPDTSYGISEIVRVGNKIMTILKGNLQNVNN
ncbi:MAG TPA: type I restriction endonuclease subunit R [Syntrophorhabdaceae bacterium]|nr:type I restriction endonuclease subunit R [Syntrophorhabdaceae bacterium]